MFYIVNPKLTINLSRVQSVENLRSYYESSQKRFPELFADLQEHLNAGLVVKVTMLPVQAPLSDFQTSHFITEKEADALNAALVAYNQEKGEM